MHTICIFKGRRAGTDDHLRDDGWQYSLWITSLSISSCSNFHARTWLVKVVVAHKVIHVVSNTDSSLCWGHIQRWKVSWWIGCLKLIWYEWGSLFSLSCGMSDATVCCLHIKHTFTFSFLPKQMSQQLRGSLKLSLICDKMPFSAFSTKSEHEGFFSHILVPHIRELKRRFMYFNYWTHT